METIYVIGLIIALLVGISAIIVYRAKPNEKIKKILEKFSCCS